MSARPNERGAVLLTTLLLMAVMAAITIAIVDDIRFSITRAGNVQTAEQLSWYERGGEDFAAAWLTSTLTKDQRQLSLFIAEGQGIDFPIDGGAISFIARDGNNCYNVNHLAEEEAGVRTVKQFSRFLKFIEFDNFEADTLAAAIQDWVDANGVPGQGGAEDFAYLSKVPAHHAANTLMVDITELRAIQGIDEDIYQRLKPFLCVGTDAKMSRINLNTLTLKQAPLLALVLGSEGGLEAAEAVIAQRPAAGYDSIDQVWNFDVVSDLELKGAGKDMVSVTTDKIALDIRVAYQEQVRVHTVLFSLGGADGVRLISRRGGL